MTGEGQREAAGAELDLADEELRACRELFGSGLARVALTRAYFAVFHAVRARLYADGLEPRSHIGAQRLFNLHFVKTGAYDPATSRLLARLQKFREEADYGQAFVVDDEGAGEEIAAAEHFEARVRTDLSGQA